MRVLSELLPAPSAPSPRPFSSAIRNGLGQTPPARGLFANSAERVARAFAECEAGNAPALFAKADPTTSDRRDVTRSRSTRRKPRRFADNFKQLSHAPSLARVGMCVALRQGVMILNELFIIYLAAAAPFGVARFLSEHAGGAATHKALFKAAGTALGWPFTSLPRLLGRLASVRTKGTNAADRQTPDERRVEEVKRAAVNALRVVEDLLAGRRRARRRVGAPQALRGARVRRALRRARHGLRRRDRRRATRAARDGVVPHRGPRRRRPARRRPLRPPAQRHAARRAPRARRLRAGPRARRRPRGRTQNVSNDARRLFRRTVTRRGRAPDSRRPAPDFGGAVARPLARRRAALALRRARGAGLGGAHARRRVRAGAAGRVGRRRSVRRPRRRRTMYDTGGSYSVCWPTTQDVHIAQRLSWLRQEIDPDVRAPPSGLGEGGARRALDAKAAHDRAGVPLVRHVPRPAPAPRALRALPRQHARQRRLPGRRALRRDERRLLSGRALVRRPTRALGGQPARPHAHELRLPHLHHGRRRGAW